MALPVAADMRLREVGFGDWEGHSADELRQRDPQLITRFYSDPVRNRPSGAEPLDAFSARVNAAIGDILKGHQGQHTLVVTHAGVIRATLGHVTQAPAIAWYRSAVDNAAISRFAHDGERSKLLVNNWRPVLGTG
mgnify:CR=1 FL=1